MKFKRLSATSVVSNNNITYEIGDEINQGGNGIVYECYDKISGDKYALKVLKNLGAKPNKRFDQEVELLKSYEHDYIIKCYGSGQVKGEFQARGVIKELNIPFCILEFAESDLKKHLTQNSWDIPYEKYISQFRGLASALAKLHSKAIHRDIKAENILVVGEKWVLADLGLCKLSEHVGAEISRVGENIGPRFNMSPEAMNLAVCSKGEITAASDIYQLVSVFWIVVNQAHPTGIVNVNDWSGPKEMYDLMGICLAHNSDDRPQCGQEFLDLLEMSIDELANKSN